MQERQGDQDILTLHGGIFAFRDSRIKKTRSARLAASGSARERALRLFSAPTLKYFDRFTLWMEGEDYAADPGITLDLPSLESAGVIAPYRRIAAFNLNSLKSIGGLGLRTVGVPIIELPSLEEADSLMFLDDESLERIEAPALVRVTSAFRERGHPNLDPCSVLALKRQLEANDGMPPAFESEALEGFDESLCDPL